MENKPVTIKIKRFNRNTDTAPSYQEYKVKIEDDETVLNLVKHIHDSVDRTLAYRNVGCYIGFCTACLMSVNGKNVRACTRIVKPGEEVVLEPAKKYPVVRDLVVDFGVSREQFGFEALDETLDRRGDTTN